MMLLRKVPVRLGQATSLVTVVVTDSAGKPVSDARVLFEKSGRAVAEGASDSHGRFMTNLAPSAYDIRIEAHGLTSYKEVSAEDILSGETVVAPLPVTIPDRVFRWVDLAVFGTAAGLFAAGSHFKVEPLKVAGEVVFGAAIFGLVYRISNC